VGPVKQSSDSSALVEAATFVATVEAGT